MFTRMVIVLAIALLIIAVAPYIMQYINGVQIDPIDTLHSIGNAANSSTPMHNPLSDLVAYLSTWVGK